MFTRPTPWWNGLMYSLLSGNPFGRFAETLDNIRLSLVNAKGRAPDDAAQHAIQPLADDPALAAEQGAQP